MSKYFFKGMGAALAVLSTVSVLSTSAYATGAQQSGSNGTNTMIGIKVYLEGALGGVSSQPMRTDLWAKGLLDTVQNPTLLPQSPCSTVNTDKIDENAFSTLTSKPVDWVCIELREANDPSNVVTSFEGVLLANGFIYRHDRSFLSATLDANMAYHVVVNHRSHLAVASPAIMPGPGGFVFHDSIGTCISHQMPILMVMLMARTDYSSMQTMGTIPSCPNQMIG